MPSTTRDRFDHKASKAGFDSVSKSANGDGAQQSPGVIGDCLRDSGCFGFAKKNREQSRSVQHHAASVRKSYLIVAQDFVRRARIKIWKCAAAPRDLHDGFPCKALFERSDDRLRGRFARLPRQFVGEDFCFLALDAHVRFLLLFFVWNSNLCQCPRSKQEHMHALAACTVSKFTLLMCTAAPSLAEATGAEFPSFAGLADTYPGGHA